MGRISSSIYCTIMDGDWNTFHDKYISAISPRTTNKIMTWLYLEVIEKLWGKLFSKIITCTQNMIGVSGRTSRPWDLTLKLDCTKSVNFKISSSMVLHTVLRYIAATFTATVVYGWRVCVWVLVCIPYSLHMLVIQWSLPIPTVLYAMSMYPITSIPTSGPVRASSNIRHCLVVLASFHTGEFTMENWSLSWSYSDLDESNDWRIFWAPFFQ